MVMTTDEILRDYRAAKSKQNQIGVLADLNCCKARDIVNILLEAGEHVPGNFLPGKREKKDVPVAVTPTSDETNDDSISMTKAEAYSLAEFIDMNLIDCIRKDTDLDSMQWLINIVQCFKNLCQYGGYESLTCNGATEE